MNPLLFANLGSQRRLLESGTAYGLERLVVDVVAVVAGVGWIVGLAFYFKNLGELPLPEGVMALYRVGAAVTGLFGIASTFLGWAFMRAFLDIADASIAISLGGCEQQTGAPAPPLNPFAEETRPEDCNYMPSRK